MAIPIPDLTIDEAGISCTLSFNRSPFWCRIPWHAIYALVGEDGRGGVWPEDVPPEIQQQKPSNAGKGGAGAQKKPRPRLTSVATAKDAPDASGDAEARDEQSAAETPEALREGSLGAPTRPESSPDDGIVEAEPRRVALAAVPRDSSEPAPPVSLGDKAPAQPARQGPTQLTLAEAAKPGAGRSAPNKGGAPSPPGKDAQPPRPAGSPPAGSPPAGSPGASVEKSAKKGKREIPPYLRVIK
jgi:hypothetical protein